MKEVKLGDMVPVMVTGILCDESYKQLVKGVFAKLSLRFFWEMGTGIGGFTDVLGQQWRVDFLALKNATNERVILVQVFPAGTKCVVGTCRLMVRGEK
ncbi:hypothetical protein ACE4RU_07780 [Actinobacillus seminis]|uniref:hypothetical protein n=1 Tax=Actinobacillus seminis TaxID=722 RepID=UPI003B939185